MTGRREPDWAARRAAMVREQLAARGIRDERVLAAMGAVPRERFVPEHLRDRAYDDRALPVGSGQTISQPLMVAIMVEALDLGRDDRVLEVGAGTGYAAAVLAHCSGSVVAVELLPELADGARRVLAELGVANVEVRQGDGSAGVEGGPFDAVCVSAGAPEVPEGLLALLPPGGRMVVPVGPPGEQVLVRVERDAAGHVAERSLGPVAFVPLLGEGGWPPPAGGSIGPR